jgi:glucose dehydrogenase
MYHAVQSVTLLVGLTLQFAQRTDRPRSGAANTNWEVLVSKMKFAVASLIAISAAAFAPQPTVAQDLKDCCSPTGKDWPKNGGNYGNSGYSSLTQVTKANIKDLGPAWVVHASAEPVTTPTPGPGSTKLGQQTTPIAVDGVLYFDTPAGGVMAVDGATGATKWKWEPTMADSGFTPATTRRGVSVGEGKVYTLSGGNRVVALDQNTGKMVWAVQPTDNGKPLGNTAKVATVYYNGLVYVGTNDSARSAGYAVHAKDGSMAWSFFAAYPHGTTFTDVNGKSFDAGDTWTTKDTPNDTPNDCYLTAGGAPWIHPAIDPKLNMVYWTFGNVRSCPNSQDGSERPGDNLFGNSIVALDATTGKYKWHFQSVHHDTWDLDNVHAPLLADVKIKGQTRQVLYYGSKQGRTFVLDRANGKPVLGVEERPVPADVRQLSSLTQPYPLQEPWLPDCVAYQNLGSDIPGLHHRAPPNYNGYQAEPDPAHPGQLKLVLRPGNYLEKDKPFLKGPERKGCMNDAHWMEPVLTVPSQNGGADWSGYGYSPRLNLAYIPYSTNAGAHARNLFQGGNGLRAPGVYQSGGIVAIDASTNTVKWRVEMDGGDDIAHGNSVLVTATDMVFFARPDGLVMALDGKTGAELWRFQTGFPSASGVISYEVKGEQYIALAAMGANQPYGNLAYGDAIWAFKLGGKAPYFTGPRSNPVVVSGSSEAPSPPPIVNKRRPVDNASGDWLPPNTVYLAYQKVGTPLRAPGAGGFGPPPGAPAASSDGPPGQRPAAPAPNPPWPDSTATSSMLPSVLTVPVGTTVTFTNPGDAQIGGPGLGNKLEHCATQFFEGKFNFRLQPGQSAQYTFDREGEYFYNDCTDPRPTGKVVVTLAAQDAPLSFGSGVMDLKSTNGLAGGVKGVVTASMTVPAGWTLDKAVPVTIQAPLSTQTFKAVTATVSGGRLVATFNKADIDNNVKVGDGQSFKVTANFVSAGTQKKLQGATSVTVVK